MPWTIPATTATCDAVRVLDWVQDNIEVFGGDPGNVTVFGESAGSRDTLAMMLSPLANGKFHRAIAESGGISTTDVAVGWNYIEAGGHSRSSREVINSLLIADGTAVDRDAAIVVQNAMTPAEVAAYLRGKGNYEIMNMYDGGYGGMISWPHMFRDGTVFPMADPLTLFEDIATYNEVPLMIGSNRDESKLFMVLDPTFVTYRGRTPGRGQGSGLLCPGLAVHDGCDEGHLGRIRSPRPSAKRRGSPESGHTGSTGTRSRSSWGWWTWASCSARLTGSRSLSFFFDIQPVCRAPALASYVYTPENLAGRLELAGSMSSYWAEFAYNGDPGTGGRSGTEVDWTAWDNSAPENDKFIIFDTSADAGIRMSSDAITLAGLYADLLAETGFTTQEQHCGMYVRLFGGTALWDADDYLNLGAEGCSAYPGGLSPGDQITRRLT